MVLNEIINDAGFKGLDLEGQRKVLSGLDAGFNGLDKGGQDKVLAGLGKPSMSLGSNPRIPATTEQVNQYLESVDWKNRLVDTLPAVGATAATVLGGPVGAAGLLGLLSSMGLAAGGGAAGKLVGNIIDRARGREGAPGTPMERFTEPLIEGGKMAALEPMGALFSKLIAPNAAAFKASPESQALLKYTQQHGLPMSPSTILPSKTSSLIEGVTNISPLGKMATTQYQNKLNQWLLDSRAQLIGELTGGPLSGNKKLISSISEARVAKAAATREAYGDIPTVAGGDDVLIPMGKTREYLDRLSQSGLQDNSPGFKRLVAEFDKRTSVSGGGDMTAREFQDWQSKINTSLNRGGDYRLADKVRGVVDEDLKAFQSSTGKDLITTLAEARLSAADKARFKRISKWFEDTTGTTPGGGDMFQSGKFYRLIHKEENRNYFIREFGEQAYKNLQDYADFALKVTQETAKRVPSIPESILMGGASAASGYASMSNPYLLVPHLTTPLVSLAVMKPRGWFKTWLTKGYAPGPWVTTPLKLGGRLAISGD